MPSELLEVIIRQLTEPGGLSLRRIMNLQQNMSLRTTMGLLWRMHLLRNIDHDLRGGIFDYCVRLFVRIAQSGTISRI